MAAIDAEIARLLGSAAGRTQVVQASIAREATELRREREALIATAQVSVNPTTTQTHQPMPQPQSQPQSQPVNLGAATDTVAAHTERKSRLTPLADARIAHYADDLRYLSGQTGWAQVGGRIIRQTEDQNRPDYNNVVGRTQWIPSAEWYPGLPERLSGKAALSAVEKAIAGQPMTAREKRFVGALLDIAQSPVEDVPIDHEAETEYQAERHALMVESEADIAAVTPDDMTAIVEATFDSEPNGTRRLTDDEIDQLFGGRAEIPGRPQTAESQGPHDGNRAGGTEAGPVAAGGHAADQGGAAVPGRVPTAVQEGFQLSGQTPAEVRAEAKQQEAERRQRERDDEMAGIRRQADAARQGFALTGSDRPADAAGQSDLVGNSPRTREQTNQAKFIKAPDGSIDFGEITADQAKAMHRQEGKIRLERGDESYGEQHIEERHGDDIRALGFMDVAAFVADIADNIDQIWKPGGTSQLIAIHQVGNDRVMFIELRPSRDADGDYYTVRSAFPARQGFVKNKKWEMLWEGRAQPSVDASSSTPFADPSLNNTGEKAAIPPGSKDNQLWDGSAPTSTVSGQQPLYAGNPETRSGQEAPIAQDQSNTNIADQQSEGKIDDFGEKLGGAKKDKAAALRDAVSRELSDEEIASQPLSKIWPKDSIDQIDDPFIAAVAHAARAEIPARPRQAYKVKVWVEKVKMLRGLTGYMLRGTVSKDQFVSKLKEARGLDQFAAKVALLESIDRTNWDRIGKVEEWPHAYTYAADGKTQIQTPHVTVEIDGNRQRYDASSVADVLDKVRDALGEAAQPKKMEFEVRGTPGRYSINRKGDKLYRTLKTFETSKEALDYRDSHYDDLVSAWGAVKDSDNVKETDVRGKENRPRTAQDWRNGQDATPEQFQEAFGFRGIEFGNWVGQGNNAKERQGMLNQAYDALMDLADIIGVPPQAMSLNGTLGLGFGSRGSGWASAHFEPDRLVINMTKTRGAGSLAHEWFHALDNYFQSQRGKGHDFITNSPENYYVHKQNGQKLPARAFGRMIEGELDNTYGTLAPRFRDSSQWELKEGVRTEVGEAFADLVKALNDSPMAQRAALIDKGRSGGYWSRIIERAARSFENYIIHKMMLNGYHNDYLANVIGIKEFQRDPGRYPYLLDGEIQPVANAFDTLFSVIDTKETERGVAMFSRSPATAAAYEARIDALWNGAAPAFQGVRVLDRSDALDLLGFGDQPVFLQESKVVKGKAEHNLTAEHWKKIPEWLENPAMVLDSDTVAGRLVFLAPEQLNGAPIIMAVEPSANKEGLTVNLLVNAYDKDSGRMPLRRWINEGLLRYYDKRTSPAILARSGLQLSSLAQARGLDWKILRDADLVKYRQQQPAIMSRGTGSGMALRDLQAVVDRVAKGFKNLPRVHVLSSPSDLSTKDTAQKALRDFIREQDAWNDVEGALHEGEIYLFASGIRDESRAEFVLAEHETTHYGLRGLLGRDLDAALQQVFLTNPRLHDRAIAERKRLGLKSNLDAIEEVLADIPSSELVKLNGWRRLLQAIRNGLSRLGFKRLSSQIDTWIKAGLSEQAKADLLVADLVRGARTWARTGKGGAGTTLLGATRLAEQKFSDDWAAQERWLDREAKMRGYKSIDDLAEKAYPVFEKLAALWRKKHPADALLSWNTVDYVEARRQFIETENRLGGHAAYEKSKTAGKTKLDYNQWVMVRTPNFKKWWGYDWENVSEQGNRAILGETRQGSGAPGRTMVGRGEGAQRSSVAGNADAKFVGGHQDSDGGNEIHHRLGRSVFIHPETGEPRVFYHGTADEFTEFDVDHPNKKDPGWLGRGHYVSSDEEIAATYSRLKRGNSEPRVMSLFVRPINPMELDIEHKKLIRNLSKDQLIKFNKMLTDEGYHGTVVRFFNGDALEIAVFDANSIKSATDNAGEFSEANDIRLARAGSKDIPSAKGGTGTSLLGGTRLANTVNAPETVLADMISTDTKEGNFTAGVQRVIADSVAGNRLAMEPVQIMDHAPKTLRIFGWGDLPVAINPKEIDKIYFDHGMTIDQMVRMIPETLSEPAIILRSATQTGRLVMISGTRSDKPVLLVVDPAADTRAGKRKLVVSVYPKDEGWSWVARQIREGHLLYRDPQSTIASRLTGAVSDAQKRFAQKGRPMTGLIPEIGAVRDQDHGNPSEAYKVLLPSDLRKFSEENPDRTVAGRATTAPTTSAASRTRDGEGAGSDQSLGESGTKNNSRLSRAVSPTTRSTGFDKTSGTVVADFKNDSPLKAHADYKAAKAGDVDAAARLVQALVKPESIEAAKAFGEDAIYVPVHAEEAAGRNQIPNLLASHYAANTGATVDDTITQSNRAYHTGANAMERLLARAEFAGKVEPGRRYVLVDDVTTMGSTLADLASYIRSQGGEVAGSVVLVNAMRGGIMTPVSKTVRELETRHGDEIRKRFGIAPGALTWSEAQYLLGFRTTDELRNRVAKAEQERVDRLRAKGVLPESQDSPAGVTRLSRSVPPSPTSRQAQQHAPVNPWQKLKQRVDTLTNGETLDTLIYELHDKFIDLKRLREHIKAIGGTVTDLNDAYLGEELYHGRVAKRTEDFLERELKPVLAGLRTANIDLETFERYLHARHAPEANAALAQRNPNQDEIDAGRQRAADDVEALRLQLQAALAQGTATKAIERALAMAQAALSRWRGAQAFQGTETERLALSGMADDEAKAFMDGLPAGQRQHLESLADKVDAINAKTLDLLERYGLMDKASLDAWRSTYRHYIPLHRDEAHPEGTSHPIGQGFSVKGDASRQRVGSNEKVTHILGHIAMQREAAITRGEKNRVGKILYMLAAQNPDPEFWQVDHPPTQQVIDSRTGFVRTQIDPAYKNKPNVLMVRIAGRDAAIVFNEHNANALRLAATLKNLDISDLHAALSLVARGTRWFAAVNTQYNPIFGLINFVRDVQAAGLNLSSTELSGHQREILTETLRLIKDAVKHGFRMDKLDATDLRAWEEFKDMGGRTGYRELFVDPEARAHKLEQELKALDRGQASKAAHAIVDWLSDYNEAMENVVRLAAYQVGVKNGMSRERAASLAKNLTVNFNRKGRQARELGVLYAFFNASVQGTARMFETLSGPAGRKIMLGGVSLGVINTLIAMAIMGGGDGNDDEYDKIPEFIKERSLIIPIARDRFLSIPLPLGFHVLPNIGRLVTEWALGGNDKMSGRQIGKMLQVMGDAFNPLGGSQSVSQIVAPTVIDPIVALMENRDWTGRPIYKEDFNSLSPTPGPKRTKDSASTPSKIIAEQLNRITGGTDYRPGFISWTPDQIDYVFGQLTGGLGRELIKVNQAITAPFTGDELPAHKIPLLGRVYGETTGTSGEGQKFYENIRELNMIESEIKGRQKDGREVRSVYQEEPKARLVGMANTAEARVQYLRALRRQIVQRGLPGYQDRVQQVDVRITDTMQRLNRAVRKTEMTAP